GFRSTRRGTPAAILMSIRTGGTRGGRPPLARLTRRVSLGANARGHAGEKALEPREVVGWSGRHDEVSDADGDELAEPVDRATLRNGQERLPEPRPQPFLDLAA